MRDGNITLLPKNYELANDGLKLQDFSELKSLEGFKPKIIEGVASNSDYSISDALESFELLRRKMSIQMLLKSIFINLFLLLFLHHF